ncbi:MULTISPECIES: winged helix-turn-helix transcriptional regulator [unclassified Streptomyces]|uniref:winged helix-turn-helix transcriptional regulator n=1 Tax=unclassified Streptomyces TaxID=2593676 RepID=UPI002E2A16EF|nr:helix-turn-helix domain-containing protein [Streptomyces sp. NBC_00334]
MTPSSTSRSPNSARGDLFDPGCPTRRLLDRIGTKWTSMAVKVLAEASPEEVRFAELQRRMTGISQKMLSATLQGLTRDGLVARRVEATVPPRVHYRLTPLGRSLEEPLAALREWAEAHMAEVDRANRRSDEASAGSSPAVPPARAGSPPRPPR